MKILAFTLVAIFFILLSVLVKLSSGAAGSTAYLTGDTPVLVTDIQGRDEDDDYNDYDKPWEENRYSSFGNITTTSVGDVAIMVVVVGTIAMYW